MIVAGEDLDIDIAAFKSEYFYSTLSKVGRGHLEGLIEDARKQCMKVSDVRGTFLQMLRFFMSIGRYPDYLELVREHPWLLMRIIRLADISPLLSNFLIQNPLLVDNIVVACQPNELPTVGAMRADLTRELMKCQESEERILNTLRCFKHAQMVHLLTIDLDGEISIEAVSDHLTYLADILLDAVVNAVSKKMGFPSLPAVAIIGYGKLGSREMSYSSDTDIIFLVDDVSTHDEYLLTNFARRINGWITNYTESGVLYETDFRLRPNGSSGKLICSLKNFRKYQTEKADTWEHLALVRARWCAGNKTPGLAFEQIRLEVLASDRDAEQLRNDVLNMRQRMYEAHHGDETGFDVKHDPGGIIDVEFIMQYLVLQYGSQHREMFDHVGNIRLLSSAARGGFIDAELAKHVADSYRRYRQWLHQYRLRRNEKVVVDKKEAMPFIEPVRALWSSVFDNELA